MEHISRLILALNQQRTKEKAMSVTHKEMKRRRIHGGNWINPGTFTSLAIEAVTLLHIG